LNSFGHYILEQENEDNPFERRRESIGLWKLRAKTEVGESEEVILLAESYCQLGLKPKDALHVACAAVVKANYFITTDRGILKKAIKQIQIVNPVQFIQIYAEQKEL
jgi:predicted nucleic acid-binding protein